MIMTSKKRDLKLQEKQQINENKLQLSYCYENGAHLPTQEAEKNQLISEEV